MPSILPREDYVGQSRLTYKLISLKWPSRGGNINLFNFSYKQVSRVIAITIIY